MRSIRVASLVAVSLLMGASALSAQATCGATSAGTASCFPSGTNVTVTVQNIVRIVVTPTSASLTAPTDADFTGGGTTTKDDINLQAIQIRANVNWSVTATAGTWTAPWAKPVGDAAFSTSGAAPFTPFSGTAQTLGTGAATAGTTINVSYRVNWALVNDAPGAYTLPIAFTVSST
jgi:hypothetical protein